MSTKHSIAAEKFLSNPAKVTRHDQTFWSVRAKRDVLAMSSRSGNNCAMLQAT